MSKNQQNIESASNAKSNSIALARLFMAEYPNFALDKNRELFIYEKSGIYTEVDDRRFDELFLAFLKKNNITEIWKMNRITEIKRAVYAMGQLPIVEFDSYKNLICFKNCVINLDEMKTSELSPKYYFTTKVNINYDASVEYPKNFARFLRTTFTINDGSADEETINNIVRIGGYLLYPQNRLEKMFLFLGEGANGKSILMSVFQMFFEANNQSCLDLDILSSSSSLEREKIIGSRVNFCTEAKSKKMDSEIIKKIISSEMIPISRKFRPPIDYKPITKLIVASNTQPYFNDTTHGLYRRIFPISFRNRFVPEDKYKETHAPKLKRIFRLTDSNDLLNSFSGEIQGILNLFLDGLKDLRKKEWQLKMSDNSNETLKDYKKTGDSVTYFLTESYQEDNSKENNGITAEEILQEYRQWYRANVSERPLNYSVQLLGRKMKEFWRIEPVRKYVSPTKRDSFYPIKRKEYEEISNNGDNAQGEPNNAPTLSQEELSLKD